MGSGGEQARYLPLLLIAHLLLGGMSQVYHVGTMTANYYSIPRRLVARINQAVRNLHAEGHDVEGPGRSRELRRSYYEWCGGYEG